MSNSIPTEDLLREMAALRPLARALARDEAGADDLVQGTAARALESPPLVMSKLPGWLAMVMTHRLRDERRREVRRGRREQVAAPREGTPSTAELVERHELRMRLMRALSSLDATHREAILLRYFEGLPPRKIAARIGVPVKTVDSRLLRARERMRVELDREFGGDRSAWAIACIGLARDASTAAPLVGVLMMKPLLAVFALVVLIGSWWAFSHRVPDTMAPAAAEPSVEASKTTPPARPAPMSVDRREVATTTPSAERAPDSVDPTALPTDRARVSGIVLDTSGSPTPQVELELRPSAPYPDQSPSPQLARSGADGRFSIQVAPAEYEIVSLDPRRVSIVTGLADTRSGDVEDAVVVVAPSTRISGYVVGPGDVPVGDARVTLELPEWRTGVSLSLHTTRAREFFRDTEEDGRFEFESAPAIAGLVCSAVRVGYEGASLELLTFPALDLRCRLTISGGIAELTGVVLDREGMPVTQAHVALGDLPTRSDESGRFSFEYPADNPPDRLMAVARGSLPATLERGAGPWPPAVTLRLMEDPLSLGGIVLRPDGEPIANARVWIDRPTVFGCWNGNFSVAENIILGTSSLQHETTSDEDGRFQIEGLIRRDYEVHALIPELAWTFNAGTYAAGRQDLVLRFPDDGLIGRLEGRVVDVAGTPVPGLTVQSIVYMLAAEDPVSHQRFANAQTGARTTTNTEGVFILHDVPRDAFLSVHGRGVLNNGEDTAVPDDGAWIELRVARSCEVRVENPPSAGIARSFQLEDATGQRVELRRITGNRTDFLPSAPLASGTSEVLFTTDHAVSLVVFDANGEECGRTPIRLNPGSLTVIP